MLNHIGQSYLCEGCIQMTLFCMFFSKKLWLFHLPSMSVLDCTAEFISQCEPFSIFCCQLGLHWTYFVSPFSDIYLIWLAQRILHLFAHMHFICITILWLICTFWYFCTWHSLYCCNSYFSATLIFTYINILIFHFYMNLVVIPGYLKSLYNLFF